MKILYLCSDVEIPLLGSEGCAVHIRQLVDALVALGHEVAIVCAWLGRGDESITNAQVYPIEPRGLERAVWRLLETEPAVRDAHLERDLKAALVNHWLLERWPAILGRERPDLIYERYSLFGWSGLEISRQSGIPLLLEVNAPLRLEQDGYELFQLTRTASGLETELFRGAAGVVVVSSWLGDWVVGRGARQERVEVIPNGVSRQLFGRDLSGARARSVLGLDGKRVVGYLGSFQPWHDVEGLIEAFAELHHADPETRLLLVGGGPRQQRLARLSAKLGLEPAVVFSGAVPHERVPEYIAAMDVAVVPYAAQAEFYFSPLKLFECLAVGTPTVAAAIGQIEEVVEHGRTGLLYRPGDRQELVERLRRALYEGGLGASLGAAARQQVLSQYTWENVAERITRLASQACQQLEGDGAAGAPAAEPSHPVEDGS